VSRRRTQGAMKKKGGEVVQKRRRRAVLKRWARPTAPATAGRGDEATEHGGERGRELVAEQTAPLSATHAPPQIPRTHTNQHLQSEYRPARPRRVRHRWRCFRLGERRGRALLPFPRAIVLRRPLTPGGANDRRRAARRDLGAPRPRRCAGGSGGPAACSRGGRETPRPRPTLPPLRHRPTAAHHPLANKNR
jgi:hypothetical protein